MFDANQICIEDIPKFIVSNLHKNEQAICHQRKQVRAKKEYIASRTLIKLVLSKHYGIDYQSIELYFNPQSSKLQAFHYNELLQCHLSLAHSKGLLFIAIASNTIKVGVDIEKINHIRDIQALAKNYYHPTESEYIQKNRKNDFYRLWTLKEAFSKMMPQAMATTLKQSIQENLIHYYTNSGKYLDFDLSIVSEKSFKKTTVALLDFNLLFEDKHAKS